jgi:hypothetical protein
MSKKNPAAHSSLKLEESHWADARKLFALSRGILLSLQPFLAANWAHPSVPTSLQMNFAVEMYQRPT